MTLLLLLLSLLVWVRYIIYEFHFCVVKGELHNISYKEQASGLRGLRITELEDLMISQVTNKSNCTILSFTFPHIIGFAGKEAGEIEDWLGVAVVLSRVGFGLGASVCPRVRLLMEFQV